MKMRMRLNELLDRLRPVHISPYCPDCGTHLVLDDDYHCAEIRPADLSPTALKEWACPRCEDHGLWIDLPAGWMARLDRPAGEALEEWR